MTIYVTREAVNCTSNKIRKKSKGHDDVAWCCVTDMIMSNGMVTELGWDLLRAREWSFVTLRISTTVYSTYITYITSVIVNNQ